jgi:acyl dehydratase
MRFFEDFNRGDILRSRDRTITETDIVNFCGLWTQLDALHKTVMVFYGIDRMRTKPVHIHIGDTIQLTKRLLHKEERGPEHGLVAFETVVVNQKNETVLIYSDKLIIRRRP